MGAPCFGLRLLSLTAMPLQPLVYLAGLNKPLIDALSQRDFASVPFKIVEVTKNYFADGQCLMNMSLDYWNSAQKCFAGETFLEKTCDNLFEKTTTGERVCLQISEVSGDLFDNVISKEGWIYNSRCYADIGVSGSFATLGTIYYAIPIAIASYYILKKTSPYTIKPAARLATHVGSLCKRGVFASASWLKDKVTRKPTQIELTAQKVEAVEKALSKIVSLKCTKKYEYLDQLICNYELKGNLEDYIPLFMRVGASIKITHIKEDKITLLEAGLVSGARMKFSSSKEA